MPLLAEGVSGVDPFDRRMRVLHVLQPTEAGVWRYTADMARFQAQHGWDVHVAGGRFMPAPVHWHQWVSVRNPLRGLRKEMSALRAILREVRPEAVVAHSAKAGLVARLVVRGAVPTVYLPHAWSFSALTGPMAMAAVGWERFAARYSNVIVGVGEGEVARGLRHGIRAAYFLVPNPVPPGWDGDLESTPPPTQPQVVYVGRLSHQKGVDVLLTAWEGVRRRVPEAQLTIVGDGPLHDELRERAGPGVAFLGNVDDPAPHVRAATVVAVPSRWEGLSLAMLEAMASGRSLVVSAVDGCEVVRAADAGAVVPVGEPDALAGALAHRLAYPEVARREGQSAAAYVRRHHDFEIAARRLAAVISRAGAFGRPVRTPGTI